MKGLQTILALGLLCSASVSRAQEPQTGQPTILDLKVTILDLVGLPSTLNGKVLDLQGKAEELADQSQGLSVKSTETDITVSLPGDVLFAFDSDAVSKNAEPALEKIARFIASVPAGVVVVEGHTDSVGTQAYNHDLSRRRARSVAAWLTAHGVPEARLTERGKGEGEPVATNETEAGKATNRRVDFIVPK